MVMDYPMSMLSLLFYHFVQQAAVVSHQLIDI
jgi:hypothetical protein